MTNKVVTSLSLPSDILKEAEKIAREKHQSRSEFFKEAVLEYMSQHRLHAIQEKSIPYAIARGVQTEEDVENVIRDLRERKKHRKS